MNRLSGVRGRDAKLGQVIFVVQGFGIELAFALCAYCVKMRAPGHEMVFPR